MGGLMLDPSLVGRIGSVGGAAQLFYWGVPPVSAGGVFPALLSGPHESKI